MLDEAKPVVMGILNVTEDSFYDGGLYLLPQKAVQYAEKMIKDGADIIDIGAESTRPGYTPASAQSQLERLVPVIEGVKQLGAVISVDTTLSEVAEKCLQLGADVINDVSMLADERMADVVAQYGAGYVLTHNDAALDKEYHGQKLWQAVSEALMRRVELLLEHGVKQSSIVLDLGIGFNKTYEQNLELVGCTDMLTQYGFPVLTAVSRKSVVGITLDVPTTERLEGTLALTASTYMDGARLFRVHDVKENAKLLKMLHAVYGRNG